ncbi:DUF5701 family protein [Demequina sp. NBRC 110057]|uniref:DUF5701 family protein n=1 Tax=Demequina sp. NBRC 110057 TaxID=1570346 RepID=UPI001F3D68B8|nr:DUF5701 family protein [Demequina sp. NBRC 110057]
MNAATSAPTLPELDRQVDAYVAAGYPALAGMELADFRALFAPVAAQASALGLGQEADAAAGTLPFLAVVTDALVDPAVRVPRLRLAGSAREGILDRNHGGEGLAPYRVREELGVPDAPVYLLTGIDRGDEFRGVAPAQTRPVLAERRRSPLTIAEGLSLVAAHPEMLVKNHCFMLDGSTRGDKRVPALWISERSPKLGWCFDKVPHTWLGIASAAGRH